MVTRPQHAGGPPAASTAPEPPFAERARTLLHVGRHGALATHARKRVGFPFASVMPYGLDAEGRPTLLISTMAMHTQNLLTDPRASLLVAHPGWTADPLAGARVTLVGEVRRLESGALVRDEYLTRHPNARHWVDFDDFAFFRMEVADVYYVAGFGAMGWVDAAEYGAASPDPLVDVEAAIVDHMNDDHADALVVYCRHYAGVEAESAAMTSVDRLGFRIRARTGDRLQGLRINFPTEVRSSEQARRVLVAMLREVRGDDAP
ncbi:MAG: HugZ family protein [Deltaproteobacteria bacterium]|nr:HugZ family protein [Deltaproteobacteria bacterium]